VRHLKVQASHSDYMHTEFEAGAPGTVFRNKGNDLRVEARHARFGAFEGVVGLQAEDTRFSADGLEAFAPHSRSRSVALFAFEELAASFGKLTFGARTERVSVTSTGNPLVPRFTTGTRSFSPSSLAAGLLWNIAPAWQLTSNLSSTRRAPRDYELFADGPHLATHAWEIGNPALREERSRHLDLGLQWKHANDSFKLNAFRTRFANFISLQGTGLAREVDEEAIPEFAYRPVRATFQGAETSGKFRLHEGGSTVDLEVRGDLVRAKNAETGEPLPRIAPWRGGATLMWAQGSWGARVGFDHFAAQRRVPVGEIASAAYTLWSAALTLRTDLGPANVLWYARLDNATDRLAYSATSILTQTAPGKAPLPGRSVKVGLQAAF
jgi:iron complex outermembrane receptor protein